MRRILGVSLLLCGLVFVMGSVRPSGYADRGYSGGYRTGYVGSGSSIPDTFSLLIKAPMTNIAAVDSGWADTTGSYSAYDTVVEAGDGSAIRWGTARSNVPDTPYYVTTGIYGRNANEYDHGVLLYQQFIWADVSSIPDNARILSAYLLINSNRFNTLNFSAGGYAAVRVDTVMADYAMVASASGDTVDGSDACFMNLSWNEVNRNTFEAWDPPLSSRDDRNDFGPRGQIFEPGYDIAGEKAVRLDFASALQQHVDAGNQDQGVILVPYFSGMTGTNYSFMAGDTPAQITTGNPMIVVTYTNRRGNKDWGTTTMPIVFGADDGFDDHAWMADVVTGGGHPWVEYANGNGYNEGAGELSLAQKDSLLANNLVQFVMHSRTHAGFGTLDEGQLDYELSRDWFPGSFTSPPDTLGLIDFSWPGAGHDPNTYRMAAIGRMIANGYRSSRATSATWSDSVGQMTYAGLDNFVNMYLLTPTTAPNVFGTSGAPNSESQIREATKDLIDRHMYNYGRAPLILFTHGPDYDGGTYANFLSFVDIIESMPNVDFMNFKQMVTWRTRYSHFVQPDAVTVANGATTANETSAAMYDSLKSADGVTWPDSVWISPADIPGDSYVVADLLAPEPPASVLAFGGDEQVVISWSAGGDGSQFYDVYRYYEGSVDTTLVAEGVSNTFYSDVSAVNGTRAYYFVSAKDEAGNESFDSAPAFATPKAARSVSNPPYFAMWHQDPPDAAAPSDSIDALSLFDAVVMGPFFMEGAASEPYYVGLRDSLVARNPDIILFTRAQGITPQTATASWPVGSSLRRWWDFLDAVADSNGWGRNLAGYVMDSDAFPTLFTNIMNVDYADTLARYLVDSFEGSGIDGDYTGFFIDIADSVLSNGLCNSGDCRDAMDYDQDGTAFENDADEKAAFKAYQRRLTTALRREFAERDMNNRLILHNGTYARNNASIAALVDGWYWEGWNRYMPGPQGSEATWESVLDRGSLLVNSQINPPMAMFGSQVDSSSAFIVEPIALAAEGWAHVSRPDGDYLGGDAIPAMVRRLPVSGAISSYDAANDTLVVTAANYTARLDINHAAADTYTVWPYFIVSGTDTISRGGGWPRQIIAPLLTDAEAFDASISISWDEEQLYGIPGYDRTEVYRSTSGDSTTMTLFDYGKQIGEYWNVNVPNDSTYYYSLKNTDVWGQRSTFSDIVPLTPSDLETLFLTFAVASPDPPDTTDSGNLSADVSATLTRDVFVKPMFRRHDGGYADWADTSSTFWLNPAATDWSAFYDTGVPVANAAEDSGGIRVTWDAGTGQSGYLLQMSANGGSWVTVDGSVSADSTGFTHTASASPPPRRGELRYRLYGYNADPDTTAVATHDSLFYNQAVRIYGKFLAIADTNAAHTGIIESPEQSVVYISYPAPAGPDTDPPDTTGVFAGVVADTSDTDNVILTLSDMTLDEIGQVQFQWSEDSGATWLDAEEWSPTNPSVTVGDTIHTLASTAEVAALNVYTRFRLRDDEGTPNVSGWSENTQAFTRMSPSATDTIGYSDTAYDDSRDITGLFSYGARIVMTESGSITKASAYLTVATGDYSIKAALYTDDGANRGDLVAEGSLTVSSGGATGWHEVTFDTPYAATGGEDFYIFFKGNDTSPVLFNFDYETAGTPELSWYRSTAWASFPDDPISPGSTYNDRRFAAYLEYE